MVSVPNELRELPGPPSGGSRVIKFPRGAWGKKNKTRKEPNNMTAEIRRTQNMLVAVDEFIDDHAITPPIAKATAEIAILKSSITELATLAANQDAGRAEWRGASDDRVRLKVELREKLSEISAISKVLDPATYPTARAQFKMTVNGSYASYITRGHAFLQAVGPM
jgi:hypothetical protein